PVGRCDPARVTIVTIVYESAKYRTPPLIGWVSRAERVAPSAAPPRTLREMSETKVHGGARHKTITGAATVLAVALLTALVLSPLPSALTAFSGSSDLRAGSAARAASPTVASNPELASELEQSLVSAGHSAEAHEVLTLPLSTVSRFLEVN